MVQRPRGTLTVDITATSGPKEDTYLMLAAVDEGILLLTGYQSPDPVKYFSASGGSASRCMTTTGACSTQPGAAAVVRQGGDSIGARDSPSCRRDRRARVGTDQAPRRPGLGHTRRARLQWRTALDGRCLVGIRHRSGKPAADGARPGAERTDPASVPCPRRRSGGHRHHRQRRRRRRVVSCRHHLERAGDGERTQRAGESGCEAASGCRAPATARTEGVATVSMQVTGPANFSVSHACPIRRARHTTAGQRCRASHAQPGKPGRRHRRAVVVRADRPRCGIVLARSAGRAALFDCSIGIPTGAPNRSSAAPCRCCTQTRWPRSWAARHPPTCARRFRMRCRCCSTARTPRAPSDSGAWATRNRHRGLAPTRPTSSRAPRRSATSCRTRRSTRRSRRSRPSQSGRTATPPGTTSPSSRAESRAESRADTTRTRAGSCSTARSPTPHTF